MESCKHMNFEASVNVARIEGKGRFMAEIQKKAGRLLDGREHNGFPIQPARGGDSNAG